MDDGSDEDGSFESGQSLESRLESLKESYRSDGSDGSGTNY
jgi:hypothetical protein